MDGEEDSDMSKSPGAVQVVNGLKAVTESSCSSVVGEYVCRAVDVKGSPVVLSFYIEPGSAC